MIELLFDENIDLYRKCFEEAEYKTVYHNPDYLLAEEAAEDYPIVFYLYEEENEFVILPSVKRRINDIDIFLDLKEELFDIKTPHEYSGVLASCNSDKLIKKFYLEFQNFTRAHNIVFSFIRFNPYTKENELAEGYTITKSADQVWIDCVEDAIWEGLTYSYRRKMRYAERENLKYVQPEKNEDTVQTFMNLYKRSMNALKATPFFYFNDIYFHKLIDSSVSKLHFVYNEECNNLLAAAITLYDEVNKIGYYHLGCRNREALEKGYYEFLITKFTEDLKKQGCKKVHLGGGNTLSLREFKERFSKKRISYYTGYIVYNKKRYQYLCSRFCEVYPDQKNSNFLPLYRSKK